MVSNSNNNIILVILIIFIVLFICISYYNHNKNNKDSDNSNSCGICNENFTTTKNKVKFEKKDNVKYFDNKESPSDISTIEVEKEYNNNNIEEFDYGNSINITKDYKDIDINKDSTKLTNFEKVTPEDTISQKFNKLLGNIENDISGKNLNLIQGVESKLEPLKYKTEFIYNNTLNNNTSMVNHKYQPFNGNSYRSI